MRLIVLCFLLCGLVAEMSAVSFKLGPLGRVPTFVRKIVNRSSANKRNEASATEAQRKSSYPIKNIKSPKHPLYPVVSEMRQNLAQLREEPNTELQLDVQRNEYLDKIIEYYYQEFLNRCAQYTRRKQYAPLKDTIVNECTDVCNELTASLKELSYEGHLMELQSDIDNYIQQIPPDETMLSSLDQVAPGWRSSVWFARAKWVAAQLLMLALNFGQYEVHRRLSIRAAEKRLAEVPEFPLL